MIYDYIRAWWGIVLAGSILLGSTAAGVWLVRYDRQEDARMRVIPYEMTPHSLVRCYNKFGALVYEDKVTDRAVSHILTRLPCGVYYGGGCCISDPPKDGETDSRRWGIGYTDTERVVDIDGRGIECVVIRNIE